MIGQNGAGKSNFINFFRLMNKLVQKDLQFFLAQQGGADRFLHFGRQITDAIDIHLSFKQNAYVGSLVPDQTGGMIFKEEYCLDNKINDSDDIKKQRLASRGDKESALPNNSSTITSQLSDWQVYHFHYAPKPKIWLLSCFRYNSLKNTKELCKPFSELPLFFMILF